MLNPKPSGIRVEKLSTSIGVFLFILFLTPVLILNKERKSYVKSFRFSNKFSFKENPKFLFLIFGYFCTPISISNKERKPYRWPEKSSVYPERVVLLYNYASSFVLILQIYALQLQKSFNTKIQEYGPFWSSVSVEVTLNVLLSILLKFCMHTNYKFQYAKTAIWSFVDLSFFHTGDYKSTPVKFVKLKFVFSEPCYIFLLSSAKFFILLESDAILQLRDKERLIKQS